MEKDNYWDEFEYSKLKLLLNREKVDSILDVYRGKTTLDQCYPISVELHLTDLCNLKCEWCTDKELRNNSASLDLNVVERLMDEFGENGTGVTIEGGGEPTIHPNFKEIVEIAAEAGVDLGLITNGTVDISAYVNLFKWVRVSLDSSTPKEYIKEKGVDCFKKVLDNLKMMTEAREPSKTYIGVGYVLTTRNQGDILNLVSRLDEIGVDYIYFRPVEEAGDITPSIDDLLELKKKLVEHTRDKRIKYMLTIAERVIDKNAGLPCIAHTLTSIIHANGDVAMCEKRRKDNVILGNLHNATFKEIWMSDYHKQISQKLLNAECQSGCSTCRITGFNMIFNQLEKVHTKHFI